MLVISECFVGILYSYSMNHVGSLPKEEIHIETE